MNEINLIQSIRINILPPYTYDEDEGEQDDDEYIGFYKENIDLSISSTMTYMEALLSFKTEKTDSNFTSVLEGRKKFIKYFPYAYDELDYEKDSDAGVDYMRRIYENDFEIATLEKNLRKYLSALETIRNNF